MIMKTKSKASSREKERNIWKMVSVVFIVLFIIILAWGLTNIRPRPSFTEPTQGQIDMAESIVAQDLQARGDNISNYEVSVTNRIIGFIGEPHTWIERPSIREIDTQGEAGFDNLQVSLRGNSTAYLYIVNTDSEKIVMRSFTEWLS
jgi:hypothetical protein